MSETIQIPKGWKMVKFEDVVNKKHPYPIGDGDHGQIKPGDYSNEGIPYIRVADIVDDQIVKNKLVYIPNSVHVQNKKSHLFPGDILIAKTGATIGKVAIIPDWCKQANTTSSIGKISVDEEQIMRKLLYYFIKSNYFKKQMWAVSKKTAQPGFGIGNLKKFVLPLPPLSIQKKIIPKLDEILSQLERKRIQISKETSSKNITLLTESMKKQIIQSIFLGKLTKKESNDEPVEKLLTRINSKIKEKNENKNRILEEIDWPTSKLPIHWKYVRIKEVCNGVVPGRYKPEKFDGDIPWITLPDIRNFYVSKSIKNQSLSEEEAKKVNMKIFPPKTILMSCVGELGRISISECKVVPNQQLHGFISYDKIVPEYIAYALMSITEDIKKKSTKTTMPYLNKTKCNNLIIPLTSVEEQGRIVTIINEKFNQINLINVELEKILKSHKNLNKNIILAKNLIIDAAFSGKLIQ